MIIKYIFFIIKTILKDPLQHIKYEVVDYCYLESFSFVRTHADVSGFVSGLEFHYYVNLYIAKF